MNDAVLTPAAAQAGRGRGSRARHKRLSAIEALERGIALFRSTFATDAWRYYVGAAPFVVCFIPLWVIDGQIKISDTILLSEALLLTAAYLLRVWAVTRYMQSVRERAFGAPKPKPVRIALRITTFARLLTWNFFLSTATLATLVTVAGGPWFYTASQFAVFEAQEDTAERRTLFGCLALASQWYGNSLLLFVMLFPLWGAVFINGLIMALFVPGFLHALFGVNTLLSTEMGVQSLLRSSAFWFASFAGIWIALDPIVKCTFLVVYQHLRSRRDGDDLRGLLASLPHEEAKRAERAAFAEIQRTGVAVSLVIFALLLAGFPRLAGAQTILPPPTSSASASAVVASEPARVRDLREALNTESRRTVYRWHDAEHPDTPTWLDKLFEKISHAISKKWEALKNFFSRFWPKNLDFNFGNPSHGAWHLQDLRLWIALVLVLSITVAVFLIWRRRQQEPPELSVPIATGPLLDLNDASVAIEHSEDEWFALANRLEGEGELRLAVRAAYLGLLAGLSQREWLTIRRDRTNREYLDEFARRWKRRPEAVLETKSEIPEKLRGSLRLFDRVWYGSYDLSQRAVAAYLQDQRELLNHV